MKHNFSLYFKAKIKWFAAFQVLFFTFMWMSKTVHVLFFEKSESILNFGMSYSAMALAGYFSFVIGYFCDGWGVRRTLTLGGLCYAAGLYLRIYPDSASIAITSGVVAGIGASSVLSALRLWMLQISDRESTASMVGVKTSTSALGNALGCVLAGIVSSVFVNHDGNKIVLLSSAFGVFILTVGYYLKTDEKSKKSSQMLSRRPWHNLGLLFKNHRRLALMTSVLGVMTGFYVSFISPYLPLIMKDKGLDLVSIGLSTALFAVVRFLTDPIIAQIIEKNRNKSLVIYLSAEVMIALATGFLLFQFSKWAFVIVLFIRSLFLGFSTISEEVLWLRTIPRENVGLFMGLNQSSYFIGDFLGGLGNGYLYKTFGLDTCIFVVLFIMIVNATLFIWFFKSESLAQNESQLAEAKC